MGNALSPDGANLNLAMREAPVFAMTTVCQPAYAARYIDDYTLIFRNTTLSQVQQFLSVMDAALGTHLNVTWEISDTSMNTLDLHVFKGPSLAQGRLDYKVHQKTLNKYMYLPIGSAHKPNVHKAWIKAELIRYITHSSREEYYVEMVDVFTSRLVARGLGLNFLNSVVASVSYADKHKYLYPDEVLGSSSPPLALVVQYDSATRHIPVSAIMRRSIEELTRTEPGLRPLFFDAQGRHRYLTAWKTGSNLGDLLCKE